MDFNDNISGGIGDDTAFFSGSKDQYVITPWGDKTIISGPDGYDVLSGIEHLVFDDGEGQPPAGPVPVAGTDGITMEPPAEDGGVVTFVFPDDSELFDIDVCVDSMPGFAELAANDNALDSHRLAA